MKEEEGWRDRAFKNVSLAVVGIGHVEPYTLEIETGILYRKCRICLQTRLYNVCRMIKERDIFPSHFFTLLIRLLF